MSTPNAARKRLPVKPSEENLKKQAKRLAKDQSIQLAEAQHRLAVEYGSRTWGELMHVVETMLRGADQFINVKYEMEALPKAANARDLNRVRAILTSGAFTHRDLDLALARSLTCISEKPELARTLLEHGADPDRRHGSGNTGDVAGNTPLWLVCRSNAPADERILVAEWLLDAGANPRLENERRTNALHQAAWRGPIAMVEMLIRHNAKTWLADDDGKLPIDYARTGPAADREAIMHLLDRPVIDDPHFRAAVNAIHAGDRVGLKTILAAHPNLATDRAIEPACYLATDYFGSPKLLWFVANNPTLMKTMPANLVDLATAIIDAGAEVADLNYTLELVMTSDPARDAGLQVPLVRLLMARGATVTPKAMVMTLGHGLRYIVRVLLESGVPMTAPVAAGLGDVASLQRLIGNADAAERHAALSMAVINREVEAACVCLDAGVDVNAFQVVHVHSTFLHQAANNDDVAMLELLVSRGARLDLRDTLWSATPLGWAVHEKKERASAYLRAQGAI